MDLSKLVRGSGAIAEGGGHGSREQAGKNHGSLGKIAWNFDLHNSHYAGIEVALSIAFAARLAGLILLSMVWEKIKGKLNLEKETAHLKVIRQVRISIAAVFALERFYPGMTSKNLAE